MPLLEATTVDGVATLRLNDPDRRNVLTVPLVIELCDALDELEDDPALGAIVITGNGPAFCAGADLSTPLSGDSAQIERTLWQIYEGFLRITRCKLPTVAAVNGAAVGAGMNLALACDVRVA